MVWGALIGAGLSAAGSAAAGANTKKALKKWKTKSLGEMATIEEQARQAFSLEEGQLRKQFAETVQAFNEARRNVQIGATAARQEAARAGARASGQIRSNMVGRGWSQSSAADQGARAAQQIGAQAVGDAAQSEAGQLAQLALSRAQGVGNARANMANFFRRRQAGQADISQGKLNWLGSYYGMKMQGVGFTNGWGMLANAYGMMSQGGGFGGGDDGWGQFKANNPGGGSMGS
jgi:hypothetical protein